MSEDAGAAGSGEQAPPAPPTPPEGGTFTQADLDAKIAERLARERKKFADYDDLKTKASELDALKQSQMSDLEKAVETAKAETRDATLREVVGKLVDAEFRIATQGRSLKPDAALTFDRSTFVTPDGSVDSAALTAWVAENSEPVSTASRWPDLGQGARPNTPPVDDSPRGLIAAGLAASTEGRRAD